MKKSHCEEDKDILIFCQIVQHKTQEQLPYERIFSRIRLRNVQELESQ